MLPLEDSSFLNFGPMVIDILSDKSNSPTTTDHPPPATTRMLPITNASRTTSATNPKKLTLFPLIFLIYFEVAGGPYGEEPAVMAAGPLLAILGFLIFPFIWSIPEALVTAELSTTFPGNGGFVIWADKAFGPFCGSLMGSWKYFSGIINTAAFPVLCIDYLEKLFPIFSSGRPRYLAILFSTLFLSFLNYTGLQIVGFIAIPLGIISLFPFIFMSAIAIPQIRPHRWLSLGQKGVKKDWDLYFNTLFWNLNYWDTIIAMAGEVRSPKRTFPVGLFFSVILTCFAYIIPLLAVTGAVPCDQNEWESGLMAEAAEMISGHWLKIWIEIGAVLAAVGLFETQLSSSAYLVLGMADLGFLPTFFGVRSRWFDTPWLAILISTLITVIISFMEFKDIVSSGNIMYYLGMMLEFASFVWLRRKFPTMERPYRVPLGLPWLVVMCLIPSVFLVLMIYIVRRTVHFVSGLMIVGGILWYFFMNYCKSKKLFTFAIIDTSNDALLS